MDIYFCLTPKFFIKEPHELLNEIKQNDVNNLVKGFEILFNYNNKEEVDYVTKFVYLCSKSGYKIQFHSDTNDDTATQIEYLNFINTFKEYYEGKRFIVVYHSCRGQDLDEVVSKTSVFISDLLNHIYLNRLNIIISLENLDDKKDFVRLDKQEIKEILYNNEDLNFTYDVCHEFVEYGSITNVDYVLEKKINNIHLHTYDNYSMHVPITPSDPNKLRWVKAMTYLRLIDYRGAVCLEYDYNLLEGKTFSEKIHNYVVSAEYINNYLEKD